MKLFGQKTDTIGCARSSCPAISSMNLLVYVFYYWLTSVAKNKPFFLLLNILGILFYQESHIYFFIFVVLTILANKIFINYHNSQLKTIPKLHWPDNFSMIIVYIFSPLHKNTLNISFIFTVTISFLSLFLSFDKSCLYILWKWILVAACTVISIFLHIASYFSSSSFPPLPSSLLPFQARLLLSAFFHHTVHPAPFQVLEDVIKQANYCFLNQCLLWSTLHLMWTHGFWLRTLRVFLSFL